MTAVSGGKRVAVIASLGSSLVKLRIELLKRMVRNGHKVVALAPEIEPETGERLRAKGIAYDRFPMAPTGTNLVEDIRSIRALTRLLSRYRPDVTLPYTMKPIIYGSMAARRAAIAHRYALFTGLGYTFFEDKPAGKKALLRALAIRLYRNALIGAEGVFAYNPSEKADIRRFRLVDPSVPVTLVPGCVDSIRHGKDGIIVPPGDAVALADAMERLACDEALTRDMGSSGRLYAETKFNVHSVNRVLLQTMGLEKGVNDGIS